MFKVSASHLDYKFHQRQNEQIQDFIYCMLTQKLF